MQFLDHLKIQEYHVQLRLEDPVQFHYFHGPALNGLLCSALNCHPLGSNLVLYPVESGRIDYARGDLYNFGVTLIGQCPDLAEQVRSCLIKHGQIAPDGKAFGRFSLERFEACDPIRPAPKDLPDACIVQFVTPLRMERKDGAKGQRFFDPRHFEGERFLRLLHDRAYDLCKLSNVDLPPYQLPEIPVISDLKKSLIWIDAPYHGCTKTFGGVVGFVQFGLDASDDWKRLLWWGQFFHVGRNSAFGFGRYLLNPGAHEGHRPQIQPAKSVMDQVLSPGNLTEAFYHCKSNQGRPGSDGESIAVFEGNLFDNLAKLSQTLKDGTYRSDPLTGIVLPKPSGKIRALAIPTVRDRVLQRAVTQILGPAWDQLLEENSFAYRKGHSRVGAAQAIQKAYNEGYRYILESDIESFFDNVDWSILADKLRSLLPGNPMVDLIMAWVMQEVLFEGQVLKRNQGVPQGAVISPLLANLYLDEFDESLGSDFRLVRYADDFVVLCKSKERAQAALEMSQEALKPLKLKIQDAKTKIVDFDQGFQYLGYLFCRSMVVEAKKESQATQPLVKEQLRLDQIPPHHWLTQVDLSQAKEISDPDTSPATSLGSQTPAQDPDRFPVYLTEPDVYVRLSGQALSLTYRNKPHKREVKIPLQQILAVIDYGRPSITLDAVAKLSQANIPTYLQNQMGKTYLAIPAMLPNHALWLRQLQWQDKPQQVIAFVHAVVSAKINNYRIICKRRDWDSQSVQDLKNLEQQSKQATTVDAIRGYEGRAAAVYFQQFAQQLPTPWTFQGRIKHPPPDPINAMLSLGYSCLYHHLATALQICGLNPGIGWYHESRSNYMALASDLQEEFRFLIDSLVLQLLNRQMVTPEDFTTNNKGHYPVLMSPACRKSYLGKIEERLLTPFKPDDQSEVTISYREFFVRQARQIVSLCFHPEMDYKPLRIH